MIAKIYNDTINYIARKVQKESVMSYCKYNLSYICNMT